MDGMGGIRFAAYFPLRIIAGIQRRVHDTKISDVDDANKKAVDLSIRRFAFSFISLQDRLKVT